MVTITFNLNQLDMEEVIALQALLTAYDRAALGNQIKAGNFAEDPMEKEATRRPIPSQLPVAVEPVCPVIETNSPAEDEAMDALPVQEEAPAKRKAGRPKKNEAAPVDPVAPTAVSETSAAGDTASPVTDSQAPTQDQLRGALKALTEKAGDLQPGISLLAEFGCSRVPDLCALPVARQNEFLARCNA